MDTVSYAGSAAAVIVNLITGTGQGGNAQGDVLTGIQNVIGSSHNDTFIANSAANTFTGGGRDAFGVGDIVSYAQDTSGAGGVFDLSQGTRSSGAAAGDVYIGISGIIGTTFDDTFIDGAGANHYEGGGGQDTVSYIDSTAGVTVDFSNNSGSLGYAEGDTYTNIQNVIGSSHNDVFIAGQTSKSFVGGGTDLNGFDTVDFLASGSAVTINAITNSGTDGSGRTFSFTGIEKFSGTRYNDTFIASAGANIFDGGSGGSDTVDYSQSNAAVTVDLTSTTGAGTSGGYAQGDQLIHVFNVIGSAFDDTFVASSDANAFDGGAGNDTMTASGGNNTFIGGAGSDTMTGTGTGNRASYTGSTAVTVDLFYTDGTGTSGGDAAGDKLSGIQNLTGTTGNDTFILNEVANDIVGNGGVDTVSYVHEVAGMRNEFRKKQLQEIAAKKTQALVESFKKSLGPERLVKLADKTFEIEAILREDFVDEVQIHVALLRKLKDALDLDLGGLEIHYASKLTPADFVEATKTVMEKEDAEFGVWFANSPQWDAMLLRRFPERHAAFVKARYEGIEAAEKTRKDDVAARIAALNLPDDEDVQAGLGKAIADKVSEDLKWSLTGEILKLDKCRKILDPVWKKAAPAG